jgi:hypothetical protein
MKKERFKLWWLALVVGVVFLLPATALAVPITVPTSLAPGDQYRLAFVTHLSFIDATSDQIANYNSFVQGVANSVAELAALGTTWKAIGSTSSVDARDNTGTNPANPSHASVPIFLLNDTKLVDDNADLWDGSLDRPLRVTEQMLELGLGSWVWTGTFRDGSGLVNLTLGSSPKSGIALANEADQRWVESGSLLSSYQYRVYALSDTLVKGAAPIPEPSTLILFGLGFLGLAGYVCRRKRRLSD